MKKPLRNNLQRIDCSGREKKKAEVVDFLVAEIVFDSESTAKPKFTIFFFIIIMYYCLFSFYVILI